MIRLVINKKSFMKFGEWSLIIFSLVLFGFFIAQYVIPILALNPPTLDDNFNVSLSTPANNGYSILANTNFTFNASWTAAYNLTNCTLWGNFSGTFAANATNATQIINNAINGINIPVTDGVYSWNVYCYNATSHGNYSSANYTVKVDLTNPVLNNPYPANNSYINNANVVFNISLTEQNINYAVNATFYYRKQGQTDWQSQTLKCWNGASPYACNYSSIDLSTNPIWLLDTNVLQFFYNTTDSASRTGVNGTMDVPLMLTLDTTQPTSVTGLAHSDDAPTGYDNDTTLAFTWTAATDATSGVKQYKIYVRESNGAYVYNGTNSSTTGYSFTGGNGNTYSINVTTVDNVNRENTTGELSSTTITVDTTQPSSPTNVAFQADPTTTFDDDTTITVTWGAASDTNGILNYKIYVSENNGAYVYNGTNTSTTGYSFTGGNGNTYTVNVTANDTAYNENTTGTVSSTTITVDTTLSIAILTVSPTLANNSYTSNNWAYVNVTFTETNPNTCLLQFNNGTASNYTMTRSGTNCYINMTSPTDGAWNYNVFVNDSANNWGRNGTYYVTVDTVNPIINETVPTNGSYFKNPSSMTFQTRLTEQNINYTVNVTVYWRLQGAPAYTSNTLNCYDSAPTWTCNITGINTGLTNGQVLQFFFNTTDSASRTGVNGTMDAPLTATVDIGAPIYSNNGTNATVAGKYDTVLIYAYWTDADTLNTAVLETNETGTATNKTTSQHALISSFTGSTAWSNFTWSNSSVAVGTSIAWKIYANDSVNNQNVTTQGIFSIDNTPPTYSGQTQNVTNGSTIVRGSGLNLTVIWSDNVRLSKYWASRYNSTADAWLNDTPTTMTSNNQTDILIGTSSYILGDTIRFKIYANDTSGNENVTTLWQYTIENTPPTYSSNNTNVTSGSTIAKGTPIYIYALWTDGIQLGSGWVQENITNPGTMQNTSITPSITLSGNWTNYTFTSSMTSSLTAGLVYSARLFANDTSGNENYTNPTWTWTIDGIAPIYVNQSDSISGEAVYTPGKTYILNISWTDNLGNGNVGTVLLNFSGISTNQTATSLGSSNYSVTLTDLVTTNYTYKWFANDTSGNWNQTIVYTFNITRNTTTSSWMNLTMGNGTTFGEANNSLAYPNINNATGYYNSNVFTGQTIIFTLYRNDSSVGYSNPQSDTARYGVSIYKYTYNTSGNANYSSASKEFWLTVVQNNTNPINITIQNSTAVYYNSNVTESAGRSITVNTNAVYGNETELKLYSNDSGNEAQVAVPYTFTPTSAKIITFKANLTSTNYTANQTATYYLTVTEDTTAPTILLFDYTNGTIKKSGAVFTLNISVSDGSGINVGDTCNVTISGTVNRTLTYLNGWCNGTILTPNVPADGNYTINITVRDNSTNRNEGYNSSFVLTVDNTTPVVTITNPLSLAYKNNLVGRIWINGTIYDLIAMGTGNVTTNNTGYTAYSFTGSNNTAFAVANNTAVSDGYVAIIVYYNDSATNTGSATIAFYVDNTPPSSAVALRNSSSGRYQPSTAQVIEIVVADALKTNDTITLNYKIRYNETWLTTRISGTAGTSTSYSATIDTSALVDNDYILYYITGSDNATNSITASVGGSASSSLANITINYYCGNNGTALTYCSYSEGWQALSTGATNQYHNFWLPQASTVNTWSSLSGNRTVPKVLESIDGKYSYLYYYNGTAWLSYDTSVAWSQSDLKYMNNTNNYPYWVNMTSTSTVRIQ